MSHLLKQRIGKLRSRVRRLLALYGLSWVIGGVIGAVMLLGLVDYVVRFQDHGIRLIASLAVVAVFGWTSYRYLYLPLATRLRDVDLARGLERWYPELEDSLASAVEFLDQGEGDPTAGSLALRRAVIVKTTAETEGLDFERALQRRPAQQAVMTATAIALVGVIVATANPLAARTAVARLINPFGSVTWPQRTHLVLRERVERVARGQAFEIEVVDREGAKLPERARVHYRLTNANGRMIEESEPLHVLGDTLVARRENVTRPFSYRVEGGDDRSMPWIPVEVVDPPAVESLAIELLPPSYTGWPKEKATGHIRALTGTRVNMTGRATKPLSSVILCLEDAREFPGQVTGDGHGFTIAGQPDAELILEKSGAYWFKLTDREKLTGGSDARWEIRVVPDNAPTVSIEQPTGTVFVTPDAMVPLRVMAKDDLAIARVELEISRSDKEGQSSLSLYTGPKEVAPRASGLSGTSELGETRRVDYAWQLAPLGLSPGTQVVFHAMATDFRPQTGRSEPARLAVITREELADRIASRQAFILAELNRVLQMQRQSRQQVATLEIRAGQIGRLDRLDLDRLRGAELNQRQVTQTLTSRTDGVAMHILGLLAELANNKVDSPDVQRRMEEMLAEIDRLGSGPLPAIGRQLTSAIKTAQIQQDPPPEGSPVLASLTSAGKGQDQVIASLEQMLGQLARWDSYRRFHRELGQLIRSQEELQRRTLDIGRRTLAKELRDLTAQEVADLKVDAREQSDLARQLDRLLEGMDETAGQLRQSDPLAADTVADALNRARELAIGVTMRSAGEGVEQNRIGQAVSQQKQAVQNLQEILDILANRRESELARLTKKLREAERDLTQLADREEAIQKQMDQASERAGSQQRRDLERLATEQEALREETERMMRRLERLLAERTAETTRQAAAKMGQASQSAEKGEAKAASFQAHQAKEMLADAAKQLADKRRQTDAELAVEQLAQLQDTLKAAYQRQEKALEETRRLDQLRENQGELSRAQTTSLFDLAREQKTLQGETQALAGNLSAAEVFQLVLNATAGEMGRAGASLDRRQTGVVTQQSQQNALASLGQLLDALKPDPPEERPGENGSAGGGGQGNKAQAPQGQGIRNYAQLKLLRMLQDDVNRRTRDLDKQAREASLPGAELRRQSAAISEEQGRLAKLVLNLIQPEEEAEVGEIPPDEQPNDAQGRQKPSSGKEDTP